MDDHYKGLVEQEIKALKEHHGPSWNELTIAQREEKLFARLFRLVCANARVEAKSGDPMGEHIHNLNLAARTLIQK